MADAGDRDGLVDGAFDAGAKLVLVLPGLCGVLGAGLGQCVVQVAGVERQLAAAALGGGALGADGAGAAGVGGELDHDHLDAALAGRAPVGAAVALGADDLPGVEVDGERGLVETGVGAGLWGLVRRGGGTGGAPEGCAAGGVGSAGGEAGAEEGPGGGAGGGWG